ncbi:3-oxoacyl-[acyl-carrier protein] reductase [Thermosporothrix hazakensis]|jgi:3-oxoacyl-[acyl-carrier protein] reductase|uniref:3-oxoacyl-[acyl-carrier protein] reductase n=1 Tax=Thermosporothrix hazakensis TaxID=644383 RepID=A0A326UNN0_THEHA|nr:SDR family oxidoreductase [Thermosporothrix hazakensis]PZW31912.1 3-oxoacyl-[acyl-carrier protein] reductase [Thermosporothrix hazakensis]GCE49763.1 3-oxoacyl-ACP reductase [Thermosporothrix hazakensis]
MTLEGKVALVTGAGGQGIGAAAARDLAARGAQVVVNYRSNQQRAQEVVESIQAAGGNAHAIQADVIDEGQVLRMVEEIVERYGRLDIMVSTKGGHVPPIAGPRFAGKGEGHFAAIAARVGTRPFTELSWEAFAARVNGELQAAFTITKAVVPVMERQHAGRLIYLSSEHSRGPAAPGMIANGAAKAALNTFVVYLAHELGPLGITANVVSPAMVQVQATRWMQPAAFLERVASATPLGRIAQPEDVARVIAFFASDDSAFMTGVYAPVTGGFGLARL